MKGMCEMTRLCFCCMKSLPLFLPYVKYKHILAFLMIKKQILLLKSICISSQEYLFTNTDSKVTEVIWNLFYVVCSGSDTSVLKKKPSKFNQRTVFKVSIEKYLCKCKDSNGNCCKGDGWMMSRSSARETKANSLCNVSPLLTSTNLFKQIPRVGFARRS